MPRVRSSREGLHGKWQAIKEKSTEFAHTVREKSANVAHNLEKNPTTKGFWRYVKTNRKEAALGALMLIGLIFSFHWVGGLVVGLAAGLYAPFGLKGLWERSLGFARREGRFPTFVVLVAFVFMLFHVFSFVIGGFIGLLIKSFVNNEFAKHERTHKK